MSGRALRTVIAAVALSLVLCALATQRALQCGEEEMLASDRAFDTGEMEAAVRHARRAAALYVPGAAHVTAAYARLRAVAAGAERERDAMLAASAWQGIRAAALESRHVWQPHAEQLAVAEHSLARLLQAATGPVAPATAPADFRPPPPLWVLLWALGVATAGASFVMLVRLGKRPSGRWALSRMRWAALLFFASVAGVGLTLVAI